MPSAANDLRTVKATPHKRFFIEMITRDISLEACLLDLIDNSVDGATRATSGSRSRTPRADPLTGGGDRYRGYYVRITLSSASFCIEDNCGGIPLQIATDYAFNFGRNTKDSRDAATEEGIGIYGIGMKRALFKIGHSFTLHSSGHGKAFDMHVDVDKWADAAAWDLELTERPPRRTDGTKIEVLSLRPAARDEFGLVAFASRLQSAVSRVYAAFIEQGLEIRINGDRLKHVNIAFLDGEGFRPLHQQYSDTFRTSSGKKEQVSVRIWAGAAGLASSRPDAGEDDDAAAWGWYVLCNNRVVLSADKTVRTGWGLPPHPQWHPQYNGFMGIVAFTSDEPYALPWTTTKDDVDVDSPVYRAARQRMIEAAREYIRYSRARKANPTAAKKRESKASSVRATDLSKAQAMALPKVPEADASHVNVAYQVARNRLTKAATALGDPSLPATQVGLKTFDYFYEHEVE